MSNHDETPSQNFLLPKSLLEHMKDGLFFEKKWEAIGMIGLGLFLVAIGILAILTASTFANPLAILIIGSVLLIIGALTSALFSVNLYYLVNGGISIQSTQEFKEVDNVEKENLKMTLSHHLKLLSLSDQEKKIKEQDIQSVTVSPNMPERLLKLIDQYSIFRSKPATLFMMFLGLLCIAAGVVILILLTPLVLPIIAMIGGAILSGLGGFISTFFLFNFYYLTKNEDYIAFLKTYEGLQKQIQLFKKKKDDIIKQSTKISDNEKNLFITSLVRSCQKNTEYHSSLKSILNIFKFDFYQNEESDLIYILPNNKNGEPLNKKQIKKLNKIYKEITGKKETIFNFESIQENSLNEQGFTTIQKEKFDALKTSDSPVHKSDHIDININLENNPVSIEELNADRITNKNLNNNSEKPSNQKWLGDKKELEQLIKTLNTTKINKITRNFIKQAGNIKISLSKKNNQIKIKIKGKENTMESDRIAIKKDIVNHLKTIGLKNEGSRDSYTIRINTPKYLENRNTTPHPSNQDTPAPPQLINNV